MKLAVEYDIEGNITIGSQYGIEAGGLEYIFVPDDMGHLQSIRIIAPIANPQQVTSTIDPGNSRVQAVLNFNVPGDVIRSLNQEFQELESSLAFESFGALRRVNWQNPRHELMAETEEEAQQIAVTNFQIQRRFPNPEVQINSRHMAKVIQGKRRYADLTVLKSFWREGMNDYNEFKFINAFNNFYLVIEGLYGAGKTQNRAILRQYLECEELLKIVERQIETLRRKPKHVTSIRALVGNQNISTVEGMLKALVSLRGRTHHYTAKGGKMYATPFDQRDFQSVAWVAMGMSVHALTVNDWKVRNSPHEEPQGTRTATR